MLYKILQHSNRCRVFLIIPDKDQINVSPVSSSSLVRRQRRSDDDRPILF